MFNPFYLMNHLMVVASGGPAGGQTFEKFDKQVMLNAASKMKPPICPDF
jgi:hypothetical protein